MITTKQLKVLAGMFKLVTAVLFFLLLAEVTGECGFTGDCIEGDHDYTCPGDYSLFVKCSYGEPIIM